MILGRGLCVNWFENIDSDACIKTIKKNCMPNIIINKKNIELIFTFCNYHEIHKGAYWDQSHQSRTALSLTAEGKTRTHGVTPGFSDVA